MQETRWKGGSARSLGKEGAVYKFLWAGCEEGLAGVGILVAEKWIEKVIEVKRISERIMVLRVTVGKSVLNIVSVYAPQVGRSTVEKEEFYGVLGKVLSETSTIESIFVCGDMNGHVGKEADGYHGVHGGNGFGSRNMEGELLLEFACAMDLVIANTMFNKDEAKKITYESGGCKTVVDYILVRECDRAKLTDVKVIPGEACIPQHRLLVSVAHLGARIKKKRKDFVSRLKVWCLKEPDVQRRFVEKVQANEPNRDAEDLENIWTGLKDCLLQATEEVCGRTKGLTRHTATWWWNQDVAKLVEEKRSRFKIWSQTRTEIDRAAYCNTRKIASKRDIQSSGDRAKEVWS